MGNFLVILGSVGIGIGLVAAIQGSLPRFNLAGRKQAAWVVLAGFLALLVGAAIARPAGTPGTDGRPLRNASPSPSSSRQALFSPAPVTDPARAAAGTLPAGIPAGAQKAVVARNVDGDTIWVEVTDPGGPLVPAAVHKIRILEIDTPESTTRRECLGTQASEFAKRELPVGSTVYLLADKEDKDGFGRFLRYVWKANGEFYNEKIIRAGLARAVLYPPNDLYITQLRNAEAEARRSARGLWTACRTGAVASPRVRGAVQHGRTGAPGPDPAGACHASYHGACLPPKSEDVDCAGGGGNGPDYTVEKDFRVVGNDEYELDRDGDGIAC